MSIHQQMMSLESDSPTGTACARPVWHGRCRGARVTRGSRVWWLALAAGLLLVTLPRPTQGKSPPTVHLTYERAANAADCPDREAVQNAVRARLGFDPFREPAEISMRASVSRKGEELRGRILMSSENAQAGERLLVSKRADCAELAAAMDLALSIAIDPLSIAREPTAPSSIVVINTPPAPVPVEKPVVESSPPKHIEVLAGITGSIGETVSATGGLLAGVGLRSVNWSISFEGRANLPRPHAVAGGHIDVGTLSATLAPCVHRSIVGGCALVTLAALRGSGENLNEANQATTPFIALGARALIEFPQDSTVAFRANVDVASPLTRTTLKVGDNAVWTTPPINVALGLAGVVRFR
jgi:hypothetical protein